MEKLKKDPMFMNLISKLVPRNYKKLSIEEKVELINQFENYAAIIQKREKLKVNIEPFLSCYGEISIKTGEYFINGQLLDNSLILMEVIFHEGYHYITGNYDTHSDILDENKLEFFKLNYANSPIDNRDIGYFSPSSAIGMKEYFFQPCEYASYKEAYERMIEILTIMKENFHYGGIQFYKIKFAVTNLFNPNNFSKEEYFDEKVYPYQNKLMEKVKINIKEENKLMEKMKKASDKQMLRLEDIKKGKVDKADLIGVFFPYCWKELNNEDRKYSIKEYALLYGEKVEEEELTKYLKLDSIKIAESIIRNKTNKLLANECGKEIDYLYDVEYWGNSTKKNQLINKKTFERHMRKFEYNNFYQYIQVGEAYFSLPKYKVIKENYAKDLGDAFKKMKDIYGDCFNRVNNLLVMQNISQFLQDPLILNKKVENDSKVEYRR